MNYQALLFDIDGTITDSEPLHYIAAKNVFKKYDHELNYDSYKKYFGGQTDADGFVNYCTFIGRRSDAQKLALAKLEEYKKLAKTFEFTPSAGSVEYIRWLRQQNIALGLVTGSLRHEVNFVLDAFSIKDAFSAIVTAEDVIYGKPHPAPYLAGAHALGLDPKQCVAVEDAPSGIESAHAAGMKCLAITTTYDRSALKDADEIIDVFTVGKLPVFL